VAQKQIPITSWKEEEFTPEIPISLARAKLTKTSAEFESNLSYERWLEIGVELAAMTDSCQWWIGDWLLHGRAKFGDEKYARAAALSGYQDRSLANICVVAESVPCSLRSEKLSWSHHVLVAPLENQSKKSLSNEPKKKISPWQITRNPEPLQRIQTIPNLEMVRISLRQN
jgi:hypothetical protein